MSGENKREREAYRGERGMMIGDSSSFQLYLVVLSSLAERTKEQTKRDEFLERGRLMGVPNWDF